MFMNCLRLCTCVEETIDVRDGFKEWIGFNREEVAFLIWGILVLTNVNFFFSLRDAKIFTINNTECILNVWIKRLLLLLLLLIIIIIIIIIIIKVYCI